MALDLYDQKLSIEGNLFLDLPNKFTLPIESSKYIASIWNSNYTLYTLSNIVYGRRDLYWLILVANNKSNPYDFTEGEQIKILLPKFLNEVVKK